VVATPWRTLSVRRLRSLIHVGHLDRPLTKSDASYEGLGLSVSLDPDAWESITPLGGGRWHLTLVTPGPTAFVDYHRLSPRRRRALTACAITLGWLQETDQFEARYYDDELEAEIAVLFPTHAAAAAEYAEEDYTIVPRRVWVATAALQTLWQHRFTGRLSDGMAEEVAHTLVLEATGLFDGVWWSDDSDPIRLSAPRGVVFQSRLSRWHAVPIDR